MDDRLKQALHFSNYMLTLNNQKRILKEKFKNSTTYYFNGGQFKLNRELIVYVTQLCNDNIDSKVLIDENNIPIIVAPLQNFLEVITDKYNTAVNDYYAEYETLRKNRSVEKLVEHE